MKKERKMSRILVICILFVASIGLGQSNGNVKLVTDYDSSIEKAYRISSRPKQIDTTIPTPTTNYPLLSVKFNTNIEVNPIEPAKVVIKDKLAQLYRGYARIGVHADPGSLAEIYYTSQRSRKYFWGVQAKHLSSFGGLNDFANSNYDVTTSNLFGQISQKRYTLKGDIHYNNNGLHYYGFENPNANRDSIAQRYSDFGISTAFLSHKKDSSHLNYTIGLDYNNYLDRKPEEDSLSKWRARENYIALNTSWDYKLNREVFDIDFNIKYNDYRYGLDGDSLGFALDSGLISQNTIVQLKPTILTQSKNNKFRAEVGFDFTLDFQNRTKAYIYPIAEVKYSLFEDLFIPYAGLRGGLRQNTFRSLTRRNEFLLSNINLENETETINAFIGMKGTLSKRIGFNLGAYFSNHKNMALFVNDTTFSMGNTFGVIYDTINRTKIEGSIYYQVSEKLKVDAVARYFSYQPRNNPFAWNLPQVEIMVRGHYNLYDKFLFNLDLNFEGGRFAQVYDETLEGVKMQDDILYKPLGFIADVNLGVEYRYNTRISAFVSFNNLAAQRYQRWFNYPVRGFQVLGGFTFRF